MIGRFFSFIWYIARLVPRAPLAGVRVGSGSAVLLSFLTAIFAFIAIILVLLGFDLDQVSLWLDRQGWWLDIVGTIMFKIMLAGILAICGLVVASPFIDRRPPKTDKKHAEEDNRPGGCMIVAALVIGYVCVVGIISDI